MFETIRPTESRALSQKPANIPDTSPLPPVCVNVQSKEVVYSELQSRLVDVTNKCDRYYQTDIVPPCTHSQFLRGMKFFVYGFWFWNALVFLVGLSIPFRLDFPYGRLDINDFDFSIEHAAIMTVVFLLVAVRCIALTWSSEFYNYAQVLFLFELSIAIFVILWWSSGLPLLMVLILSGLLNAYIIQWYFTGAFLQTVKVMQTLVPPGFKRLIDHTVLEEGAPTCEDFLRIAGYKDHRAAEFYNERCGVFGGKSEMKHVLALQNCYAQALFPYTDFATWKRKAAELVDPKIWRYFDGLLYAFVMLVVSAFGGIWLGQVLSRHYSHWFAMLFVLVPLVVLRGLHFILTNRHLVRALGVAVAEKEWMAHDVVRHQGEREQMDLGPVDQTVGTGGNAPYFTGGFSVAGVVDRGMGGGRLNMSFMWLALWVCADSVGASYVSAIASNLASESRFMIEAFTSYEFKKIEAAKWEISITLVINNMCQLLLLMLMTVLYFGTYYDNEEVPSGLVGVIGIACFMSAAWKTMQTVNFAADVLGDANSSTPRQFCVSETIMFTVMIFIFLCVVMIWVLFPIMFNYDPPAPHCEMLRDIFPSLCAPFV